MHPTPRMKAEQPHAARSAGMGNKPLLKLIDFKKTGATGLQGALLRALATPLERLLSVHHINRINQQATAGTGSHDFLDRCIECLNIECAVPGRDIAKIPVSGPLVVVANHPYGGVDGVILAATILKARPDVKILGNFLLQYIDDLREMIIPVDVFGGSGAPKRNLRGFKEAIRWVKSGGALVTFPAGEVASMDWRKGKITDPAWSHHVGAIIRLARAKVLPVFFTGRNSLAFNLLGMIHPRLRTVMLPGEVARKQNSRVKYYIGKPLLWQRLRNFETDSEIINYLRFHTYFLNNRRPRLAELPSLPMPFRRTDRRTMPLAPAQPAPLMRRELETIPAEQCLVTQKEMAVYYARQDQIPHIMREIGRLREMSFREVEEGTGHPMDVDPFDAYYLHLFLWNHKTAEVVGAYRLGITDKILARFGRKGLYTNSLFRYKSAFFDSIENALELGRSFIRPEYQRNFSCLPLLWRGIGAFIVRHGYYRTLFGPVSISHSYHKVSKNLIVEFLRRKKMAANLVHLVSARRPFRTGLKHHLAQLAPALAPALSAGIDLENFEDVSLLISEIENDGKGVPILLKHYLKLDGSFISFNVDKKFSNVVDGLVLVDLLNTNPKLLKRFMGDSGAAAFLNHHRLPTGKAQQSA